MAEFTTNQRKVLIKKQEAMPDGSYPIRNASDLKNAIQAYGRAKDKPATMAWIKKRAKELNLLELLPETWKDDSSLELFGILGMKWGVRRKADVSTSTTKEQKEPRVLSKKQKAVRVGASVVAGLLASNLGALPIAKLTGSLDAMRIAAPILGAVAGVSFYKYTTK